MARKLMFVMSIALALQIIGATQLMCPRDPNCVCGGTLAIELNCNIDGHIVKINLLPGIYINIKCENTSLDYERLPKCANKMSSFKSVSFKDCPLPKSSFKDVLTNIGVSKTMALIFQNSRNLSGYFDRKHFAGLQDLTKLLLSVNGVTHLPNNLFMDISKLTWLNIRSNSINLSEELFKPLERLETLEISHNHMTNISSNLFSHLSFLRKLSLWQSNVTWFSKDLFSGVDVLEELDLSSNGLNELPASIFKPLNKLKKLTLFSNKFSSLPENLFKNNYELETVVFLNNDVKLRDLPKNLFGNLPKLKQIYIQRSGIENVPCDVFVNSSQITNISLAYNDIKMLPEPTFNDQINLLELDLSYNRLKKLDTKLFSSLVRLERLDLSHNLLVTISGETFSSLLSLIYLNMEHNNLETISSYLFSNNKQRMSISFAYNKLSFEDKSVNKSCQMMMTSPFAHTYNLHLLNLSHNNFKYTSYDWWANGHEKLDITGNNIIRLWDDAKKDDLYQYSVKKPFLEVRISQNPIACDCRTQRFIDYLLNNPITQVPDKLVVCSTWAGELCYMKTFIVIIILTVVVALYSIIGFVYLIHKADSDTGTKFKFFRLTRSKGDKEDTTHVVIKYCDLDEEFVLKELMPGIKNYKNVKLSPIPPNIHQGTGKMVDCLTVCVKDICEYKILIIFSPNYLVTSYSQVEIKKIHLTMMGEEEATYLYVDNGPDNTIYEFLKDQRDLRASLVWGEPFFWDKVLNKISCDCMQNNDYEIEFAEKNKVFTNDIKKPDICFSKLPDPNISDLNNAAHGQV